MAGHHALDEMISTCLRCQLSECVYDTGDYGGCEYRQRYMGSSGMLRVAPVMVQESVGKPWPWYDDRYGASATTSAVWRGNIKRSLGNDTTTSATIWRYLRAAKSGTADTVAEACRLRRYQTQQALTRLTSLGLLRSEKIRGGRNQRLYTLIRDIGPQSPIGGQNGAWYDPNSDTLHDNGTTVAGYLRGVDPTQPKRREPTPGEVAAAVARIAWVS